MQIPDQYLTKQKKSSDNFGLKKKEKRKIAKTRVSYKTKKMSKEFYSIKTTYQLFHNVI